MAPPILDRHVQHGAYYVAKIRIASEFLFSGALRHSAESYIPAESRSLGKEIASDSGRYVAAGALLRIIFGGGSQIVF
ncbi:MAG TPA: hypothetical protein VHC22_25840 [Pirellulales bacterium]|nr:hypothetical protein [Pirellulales bacterium]